MDSFTRFLAVADEKSISRAAARLNVSQPALSRTISLLEDRFGTDLFKRTAAGVELTSAGTILYEYANRAARAISNAENAIQHAEERGKLILTIAAGDGWAYGILPDVIRSFSQAHPSVAVRLETMDLESRTQGLRNGNFDLTFGVLSPEYIATGTVEFLPLLEAPYDVYCHVGHPLARLSPGREPSPEELLAYPWINHKFEYDYDTSLSLRTARNHAVRTNTMLSAIEIIQGSPFLISTAKWFRHFFERNNMHRLCEDNESPVFCSGAVFQRSDALRPIDKLFLDAVIERCRGMEGSIDLGLKPNFAR